MENSFSDSFIRKIQVPAANYSRRTDIKTEKAVKDLHRKH